MKRLALLCALPLLASCSYLPSWLGGDEKPVSGIQADDRRIAVLAGQGALSADASLATVAVEVPAQEANANWEQHNGTAAQLSGNPALPPAFTIRESQRVGDGKAFKFKLAPAPVVAEGVVYAMDAGGMISAQSVKDLDDTRWISPGVAAEDGEYVLGGGLAYEQGRLFAASGKGLVAGFDAATGREIWRQSLSVPIRSAPMARDGRVFVVTVDSQMVALDRNTGAILWSHRGVDEGRGFLIEASPAVAGEAVFAPYSSGEIHGLRADSGDEVWSDGVVGAQRESAVSVFTGIGGDPVVTPDGMLIVAGSAGQLAAFQYQTGRRIWEQPVSSVNTPWVAGEYVYVLTMGSQLLCLQRADGRVRWSVQLPAYEDETAKKDPYTWMGPVLAGGRLLVLGAHGEMLEISPLDGSITARTDMPDSALTPPVVAGGALYFLTQDARLHALK